MPFKIAGEGIEYAWACAKNKYRTILLENKKGKENFIRSVRLCTSTCVLTRERVQKFARRARRYIMGYHVLHLSSQQGNTSRNTDHENFASYLSNWSKWLRNSRHTDGLLILATPFVMKYSTTRMHHEKNVKLT